MLPPELLSIYQEVNGFQVLGRTAMIYSLEEVGLIFPDIPKEYVVFDEIAGDDEKLCFYEKTGEIVTVYKGEIFNYSIVGLLEYCIDQCKESSFMAKVDINSCSEDK